MNLGYIKLAEMGNFTSVMEGFTVRAKQFANIELYGIIWCIVYPENERFSIPNLQQVIGDGGWLPAKDSEDVKTGRSFIVTPNIINSDLKIKEILKISLDKIDVLCFDLVKLPNENIQVGLIPEKCF